MTRSSGRCWATRSEFMILTVIINVSLALLVASALKHRVCGQQFPARPLLCARHPVRFGAGHHRHSHLGHRSWASSTTTSSHVLGGPRISGWAIRRSSSRRFRSRPSGGHLAFPCLSLSPGCTTSRSRSTKPPRSTAPGTLQIVPPHHAALDHADDAVCRRDAVHCAHAGLCPALHHHGRRSGQRLALGRAVSV